MTRTYLDSNVYRYLKNNNEIFLRKLVELKDRIIFYYSPAHISDLSRDKSPKKFDDLEFMAQLVDQNCLRLETDKEYVNSILATPNELYESLDNLPISNIFDSEELLEYLFVEEGDSEKLKELKNNFKTILETPAKDLGISDFTMDLEDDNPIKKLFPNFSENSSMLDFIKSVLKGFEGLLENPTIWRDFRRHSMENLNLAKFNIDISDSDFNEKLKDTVVQKSFIDFVEDSLKYNKNSDKQRTFNFFISAYNSLNILGLDKEKNKKVVFSSFLDDAQHTFYAAHCQYLVSDDYQLRLKAKVLYKLLGIETKVLSTEEFVDNINQIGGGYVSNIQEYIRKIESDLRDSNPIDLWKSEDSGDTIILYELGEKHFNFFNRLRFSSDKENNYFLKYYNFQNNYSRFYSYLEFEMVINKITALFGKDLNEKGSFTEDDRIDIQNNNWEGRVWLTGNNSSFHIEIEPESSSLCLYYLANSHQKKTA